LTGDEPNFKLGTRLIIKSLNGRADNKSMSLQHGIPNGRKIGSIAGDHSALEHQFIRRFRHWNNPPITTNGPNSSRSHVLFLGRIFPVSANFDITADARFLASTMVPCAYPDFRGLCGASEVLPNAKRKLRQPMHDKVYR
jgi:hypothetical protein